MPKSWERSNDTNLLTINQREDAKSRIKKWAESKYKTNLKKYEEIYHIPISNIQPISTRPNLFENQRNMVKSLKNMCKAFDKYNNRLLKWQSFLALKSNADRPKAVEKLFETLDKIFTFGHKVRGYKYEFFNKLYNQILSKRTREKEINESVRQRSDFKIKSRWFDSWKDSSKYSQITYEKLDKFYHKNLKFKAFFTLLRYCRLKKQQRKSDHEEQNKISEFLKNKYYRLWRQVYSHKMNQLENRKCFKVKFSDYWKWRKWLELQRDIDIKPEFDKFITNPYPLISKAVKHNKISENDNSLGYLQKSKSI